jgi:hypothetical protein
MEARLRLRQHVLRNVLAMRARRHIAPGCNRSAKNWLAAMHNVKTEVRKVHPHLNEDFKENGNLCFTEQMITSKKRRLLIIKAVS